MSKAQEEIGQESASPPSSPSMEEPAPERSMPQRFWATLKEPGSALQIIVAAAIAIAIGISVSATTSDIPEAVPIILEIPGTLWLRALRATGTWDCP